MNAITYYRSSLSAETLKLKSTFSLWLAILAPCALISMYVIGFWSKGERLVVEGISPWISFAMQNFMIYTMMLMPIFIALLTSLTNSIEHKSNGWKHLYCMPLPKSTVYIAKATTVTGLVLLSSVVFLLAYLAGGLFLSLVRPDLGFSKMDGIDLVVITSAKIFLASFVIIAVQFWLSIRWSSFALSLGVGIVAIITVMVAYRWEHIHYYPFAYPLMTLKSFPSGEEVRTLFTEETLLSLGAGLAVFVVGYFDISRKRIS